MEGEIAHIAGGLHHALRSRASGFCYINDPVIEYETFRRGKRVLYIDIDAHHGDGVQKAFYERISLDHFSSRKWIYSLPGTGHEYEMGKGKGRDILSIFRSLPTRWWTLPLGFRRSSRIILAFSRWCRNDQLGGIRSINDPLTNFIYLSRVMKSPKGIKGLLQMGA